MMTVIFFTYFTYILPLSPQHIVVDTYNYFKIYGRNRTPPQYIVFGMDIDYIYVMHCHRECNFNKNNHLRKK